MAEPGYRLGAPAQAVDRHARGWREGEARLRRWDGHWIGVHTPEPSTSPSSDRALAWLGFERLRRRSPSGPTTGKAVPTPFVKNSASSALRRMPSSSGSIPWQIPMRRVHVGYGTETPWVAGYREATNALEQSSRALATQTNEEAMVESFLLGGRVIRQLARDPLLPDELVPGTERRAVISAMRSYDRTGRRAWSAFMARHGAAHIHSPSHGGSLSRPSPATPSMVAE